MLRVTLDINTVPIYTLTIVQTEKLEGDLRCYACEIADLDPDGGSIMARSDNIYHHRADGALVLLYKALVSVGYGSALQE